MLSKNYNLVVSECYNKFKTSASFAYLSNKCNFNFNANMFIVVSLVFTIYEQCLFDS